MADVSQLPRSREATGSGRKVSRDHLQEAARAVLAEYGLRAEITQVAELAQVGAGTIYRNYRNKEDLFLEIAREMANKTNAELLEVTACSRDARQAVAETMQIGFKRVDEYGLLTVELVSGNVPDAYKEVVNRKSLANVFRLLLERGVEQGHFRSDLEVDYMIGAWFSLVAPHALLDLMGRFTAEQLAERTTKFFLAAISREAA